jgi:predicted DCC family thiol-disulfide oxidoreductase YuxK
VTANNKSRRDRTTESGLSVYYDGSCPLCSAEVGYYKARAGGENLRLVDTSQKGADLGPLLSSQDAMARFHVRQADGTLHSGAAAFEAIWDQLPGWRLIAIIARLPGGQTLLEIFYRMFLRVRPVISACYGKHF